MKTKIRKKDKPSGADYMDTYRNHEKQQSKSFKNKRKLKNIKKYSI